MGTEIRMPQLGMMMVEGTVVHWLVEDRADVKKGQDLLHFRLDASRAVAAGQTTDPLEHTLQSARLALTFVPDGRLH